ncbi:MAG: polysaccharide deacetylase family protein [Bacillus sp. (in: firmicutes)]
MGIKWKQLVAICAIGSVSWILASSPNIENYVLHLKEQAVTVDGKKDPLFEEIEVNAKEYEESPKNAMIDPVWKSVPGYNGLEVDIDASYSAMKKAGKFDEKKLIFRQIPPKVHLSDLEAEPIYRAHPEKKSVSFLINVAWGNEYLPDMLSTLKKHKVKATFFLEGRWAKNNPDLAKTIAEEGHEIGNHSFTHPNMKNISGAAIRKELQDTNEVIKAVTGKTPTLFAPPSGAFREETVKIADEYKMDTIMWSVDTIDWQKPAPDVLTKRVLNKIHNGAFVLMHPTDSTAKSLETLITEIKKKELHIKTVTDSLSEERIMH